ncbi:MAG: DUF932 domain-containing protein [Trueperaceae bacterium]|nr:DUF932 domain-containing protein [Trueperaceae bacterium]
MKQGKTLSELASELERQQVQKRDFIADTRDLEFIPRLNLQETDQPLHLPETLRLSTPEESLDFSLSQHTHRQIGTHLNIPAKYYDRMQADAPTLLAQNINHWFKTQTSERMIRTLDGKARAFLSKRYRRLDNYDLLHAVLPVLSDLRDDHEKGLDILSCEVTETKLYLKCVFPKLEAEVKRGDAVQSGIVISNSEIGQGALTVTPLIYRLICTNGMIAPDYGQRKYHVGRTQTLEEQSYELFSDEALEADDKAFWLKTRDIVKAAATPATFDKIITVLQDASSEPVNQPIKAVAELSNHLSFNQGELDSILNHFMQDNDFSRWGLANAVTRTAEDSPDYDRASELEETGWKVLTLPKQDWQQIAQAA